MVLYVYAITGQSHPLDLEGLSAVGSEPSRIRAIASGPLAAVVSDISEEIRPKRRDLLAHQEVQERLMRGGTVLPLQFGYTAADDSSVAEVLERDSAAYLATLERLAGCAEYHLRASQDEEQLLSNILLDTPEARELNERILAGDQAPQLPMALGQLVAAEVERRQDALAAGLVEALLPFAREHSVRPSSGNDFLNLSLLVPHDHVENFLTAESNLAREIDGGVECRLTGPLPPYSFVQ
ncbi:GvpL/GvpF family gas vesicle protein [Streptomyces sp. Qhu_M48]|uniref:GvpL/GvpF family gas vesicle protein n=1 Tax=Streptomyces sp. Qhu_M48 TaxID=3435889 RepID=UPI003F504437